MALALTRSVVETLLAEAERARPEECCGLLFGASGSEAAGPIIAAEPARNVAADRAQHFEIDPQALIDAHRAQRAGGRRLLGFYHSHPTGLVEPSATDQAQASGDGMVWAIVAAGAIGLWRDAAAGFEPLPFRVADG